ncbi:hypothetical protein HGB41_16590 [Massilia sp. ML15P13]|uniref:Collagen-like protein n=2 Tax=Telluria aromaticivorans TaxID=2725995 RepID=A0A7Y2P061_9BURK|nr:hypothetical protein [Telluria aromaticivorans]
MTCVRFRTELPQAAEHDGPVPRYRPSPGHLTWGSASRPISPPATQCCPTPSSRSPAAAHYPKQGFTMKHSLILLALAATFTLSACQREAPPPVVQVVAGPAGAPGATGATGATGAEAQAGATGATGATGNTGATGVTGATGAEGVQGDTGATGYDGAKGKTGDTGAQGYDGEKGDKGRTGDTVIVVPQR